MVDEVITDSKSYARLMRRQYGDGNEYWARACIDNHLQFWNKNNPGVGWTPHHIQHLNCIEMIISVKEKLYRGTFYTET